MIIFQPNFKYQVGVHCDSSHKSYNLNFRNLKFEIKIKKSRFKM